MTTKTTKKKAQLDAEIATVLGGPTKTRGPRSSVRAIRGRQDALRDYNRLVSERPEGPEGDAAAGWFIRGYEFIQRDVLTGRTPEQSFDLSSSVRGAPTAFHDGANAARCLYNSRRDTMGESSGEVARPPGVAQAELAQAMKYAKAYGVKLPS